MLSQDSQRGMAFAAAETAQAILKVGDAWCLQIHSKVQSLSDPCGFSGGWWYHSVWLQVPCVQDRCTECDPRLFGGMCILVLPQISLPRTPSLPGELAVAEASSLNNMDRKWWSVQKKAFWSHSIMNDCRLETENKKSMEGGHSQWLISKLHLAYC